MSKPKPEPKPELPNPYMTSGSAADDAAELIAELWASDVGPLAYIMLQPNPRLYVADYLEQLASESEGPPQEIRRMRRAAKTLRAEPLRKKST